MLEEEGVSLVVDWAVRGDTVALGGIEEGEYRGTTTWWRDGERQRVTVGVDGVPDETWQCRQLGGTNGSIGDRAHAEGNIDHTRRKNYAFCTCALEETSKISHLSETDWGGPSVW